MPAASAGVSMVPRATSGIHMRLSYPVYESLPFAYFGLGWVAMLLSYANAGAISSVVAFVIGLIAQIAGLTIFLHRQDCRSRRIQYPGDHIDEPQR